MSQGQRLVNTRKIISVNGTGKHVASYRMDLEGDGSLAVEVPESPTPIQALEIADQLRELADALVVAANQLEHEPAAREELLRTSELLRAQHENVHDYESARDLLDYYGHYRDAVVEYLRCASR